MRFDGTIRTTLVILLGVVGSFPISAQDSTASASSAADEVAVIDDVKLTAQRAALPYLSGDNPFVLRESSWAGVVEPGKARLIQVQLFRRNEYHFWFSVPSREAGLNLNIYDGKGELVEAEAPSYDTPNVVSLIVKPEETGIYYLRISLQTTLETPQRWAVIYAYR